MKFKIIYLSLIISAFLISPCLAETSSINLSELKKMPMQHSGRIKPFSSFAKETLIVTAGKESIKGQDASHILMQWITNGNDWQQKAFLPISTKELALSLGLNAKTKTVSPESVASNNLFMQKVMKHKKRQSADEELTFLEKKEIELYNRMNFFYAASQGLTWNLIPPQDTSKNWLPINQISKTQSLSSYQEPYADFFTAYKENNSEKLASSLKAIRAISEANPFYINALNSYKGINPYPLEVQYNDLRPFRWTWVLYLFSFFMFSLGSFKSLRALSLLGTVSLVVGFLLQTYGILLRCLIAGRPPVSNMYESVIWVSWASIGFCFLIYLFNRSKTVWIGASAVAGLGLILCDNLPAYLDPSITPLVPVLRSNYWLTIHVLTITLSYGVLALAMAVGHIQLITYAFKPGNKNLIESLGYFIYRCIQIGIILLATGTILGGVWAHYSWGRFWGWDPKETWALIALIFYLIVLHARLINWIGHFGLAVSSVVCFLGILMAWYGVNYVLSAGLHSYGFGGGGVGTVSTFVIADLAFVIILGILGKRNLKKRP